MAPKKRRQPSPDPEGIFHGMVAFLVSKGVQARRLQVWKQKLEQMGAVVEDTFSSRVTHVFASNSKMLLQQINHNVLKRYNGSLLLFQWLEDCLKSGKKESEEPYVLNLRSGEANRSDQHVGSILPETADTRHVDDGSSYRKRTRISAEDLEAVDTRATVDGGKIGEIESCNTSPHAGDGVPNSDKVPTLHQKNNISPDTVHTRNDALVPSKEEVVSKLSSSYEPPDLNRNVTELFGKLINIYRALGDDRRSFSYYKAIPVIEKLPFKIESVDQVKHLPAIGKSMQDHIHEIVTTGKFSKLEHFEADEKVRTVTLFGEIWGIGPATALKLYEKGHRTLDDLKNEDSLTSSQKIGLRFFEDIKTRIPRNEVKDMETLLQKAGEHILPGVIVVCGGSYRRGKASCGDMDIIMTHPDGQSHKGFLSRYVQYLKDIKFLREDLVFSIHSTEGTDSGVDTYFGLCTYPGRELRHRIDLKVYPREIYAFGLVAWTGNDVLNRRLRLLAESKGYRLDDTGLFLATQSSGGKRGVRASTSINCNTEKEVFDFLEYPWLEPHERNL